MAGKESRLFGFLNKKPQQLHRTEVSSQLETYRHAPIIEPATGEEKDRLERDCERILSMESITANDFNAYIDRMIKILGSGGEFKNPYGRDSNMIQQAADNYSVGITFKQYPPLVIPSKTEGAYGIEVHYTVYDGVEKTFPHGERLMLTSNPEYSSEGKSLTVLDHYLTIERFEPQHFNSIALDEQIELDIPWYQGSSLDKKQTQAFMNKTFEVYKSWRDADIFEWETKDGKYLVDFHKKEHDSVWNRIESTPQEP